MSISINNLLSQFRAQLPILTTLPEVVPAGAEFYYQGTKWRGLGAGETGLPEGTPWPVKGYKELKLEMSFPQDIVIEREVLNEIGAYSTSAGPSVLLLNFSNNLFINTGLSDYVILGVDEETTGKIVYLAVEYTNENQASLTLLDDVFALKPKSETLIGRIIPISIRIYPPQP